MSNAGVVRRRSLHRPAAALGWSPCTVYSPAGQFHSMSCSTDSPARSRHAVSAEFPYKRHFCGLAVHTVKRVLGLLPGLCEKVLHKLISSTFSRRRGRRLITRLTACTASLLNLLLSYMFCYSTQYCNSTAGPPSVN